MNPPNYYQSGGHRPDQRQDINNNQAQSRHPLHPSHMPSGGGGGNGNGDAQGHNQNQRYIPPPHHSYGSDGSPVGYGYGNATPQSGYSHYQQSPYSPYQPLAPPVHHLPPPGPSGYMISPPPKDPSSSLAASVNSQSRKIAPKKRTSSPKKKTSPSAAMPQGREKWKWDVPDEVYARMNSEEKKQVRNRCGARAFRAKRKGTLQPPCLPFADAYL